MPDRSDLARALREYDGKAVSLLNETIARFGGEAWFYDAVVDLCGDEASYVAEAATWIVKAHLDEGGDFAPEQTERYLDAVHGLKSWQAQLHACQSIDRLVVEAEQAASLADWLEPLLTHERPFLRAWSLNALCRLAEAHPALEPRARKGLDRAAEDDAASVRARARKLAAK